MTKYGHESLRPESVWTGGLADYCLLVSGTCVIKLPDDLPDSVVCPANCATATIAAAMEAAGDLRGSTVLIAGAGMLGLTACSMAKFLGAREIIVVDVRRERLDQAELFGATRTTDPDGLAPTIQLATDGRGIDVAMELTGSANACEMALASLGLGGKLILVGGVFPTRPLSVFMEQIIRRHLTLTGIHNYAPQHLIHAIQFLSQAKADPFESLVSDWLPLEEANRAFQLAQDPSRFRVGVLGRDS